MTVVSWTFTQWKPIIHLPVAQTPEIEVLVYCSLHEQPSFNFTEKSVAILRDSTWAKNIKGENKQKNHNKTADMKLLRR